MADVITERVRALLVDRIDSIVQLETLLLLHQNPQTQYTAADLARELRIDRAWAAPQLAHLCMHGLVACTENDEPRYRYAPGNNQLDETVNQLAAAYAERRVTVTSLIFSKPPSPLRSFADAFRLRRDAPPGDASDEKERPNG